MTEAAVVARADETWGETPCAFVGLPEEVGEVDAALIAWCRTSLAGHKVPRTVVLDALPRTSTGKVRKNVLRDRAGAVVAWRIPST